MGRELQDVVNTNTVRIYIASMLCVGSACVSHTQYIMVHNQVHSVCSACVTHMY